MSNYAVLGLGMMGEAIIYDILKYDSNAQVYGFDVSKDRRDLMDVKFSNYGERFKSFHVNLNLDVPVDEAQLYNDLTQNQITIVFGAIDYKYNVYLSNLCILAKANYFDLGGNPEIVRQQQALNENAKAAGVTIIPDLGLAPGMANVIAAYLMRTFDTLDECHIRVGGLPQPKYRKSILNYQQVFSIRGLTNEYLEDALVIRNRNIEKVKSMTEVEEIKFTEPYGWLEAFQTAGGTSSLPELYEGKINELTYKTIRYAGHAQFIQFLIEFNLLSSEPNPNFGNHSPREVIEFYLEKNLPKGDPDVVLMRITVCGDIKGQERIIQYNMIDSFDTETNHTAMARTTSYPLSIIGQMVAKGIINEKGVLYSEQSVPGDKFIEQLALRGIKFDIVADELN